MLRRYRSDPSHVLKDSAIQISENWSYIEEPVNIVDCRMKQLRRKDEKELSTSIYGLAISLSIFT